MEGLRVPKIPGKASSKLVCSSSQVRKENKSVLFDLPAVSLGDLLDGDPDLVAEVSPCIHHSISASP